MPGFPNRCQHIKVNGTQCGSPALRRNSLCYFHKRFHDERIKLTADRARRRRPAIFELPVLEDANSIQVALMQIMRLLVAQQIDGKTAGLLLYALQTASNNLRHTNFNPARHDVILDPRTVDETQLNEHIWSDDDFDEEEVEEEEEEEEDEEEEDDEMPAPIRASAPQKKDAASAKPPAAKITASGSAVVATAGGEKKPAASQTMEQIEEKIRERIQKGLLPPSSLLSGG